MTSVQDIYSRAFNRKCIRGCSMVNLFVTRIPATMCDFVSYPVLIFGQSRIREKDNGVEGGKPRYNDRYSSEILRLVAIFIKKLLD